MKYDLIRLIPPIRRARDWHLYDHKGNRYLDLWQEDGAYQWGHRPESLYLTMKDLLSPGLGGHFPSIYTPHLFSTLKKLFPQRHPLIFQNLERAQSFCQKEFHTLPAPWRPFTPFPEEAPGVILHLPYGPLQLRVILTKSPYKDADLISGMEAGAFNKLLGSWKSYLEKVANEKWDHEKWNRWQFSPWKIQGPLIWMPAVKDYPRLFEYFLSKKIIISPDPQIPSWIPSEFSDGELQGVKKAVMEAPWTT